MADQTIYSALEATVNDMFSSYLDAIKAKDASILSRTLAPECQRVFVPGSMFNAASTLDSAMDNAAYEAHMAPEINVMEHADSKVLNSSIDTTQKTASVRSLHNLKLKGGDAHTLEFCWFLDFTDDGTKIKRVTQFVDAVAGGAFMADIAKVMGKGG